MTDFERVDNDIAACELHEPKHFEVSSVSCNSDEHKLPQDDYSDLPDLSDSVLNDGDRIKFQPRKYRDVFAFSNDQLGRISLVQHVIDTGDAMPVKLKGLKPH